MFLLVLSLVVCIVMYILVGDSTSLQVIIRTLLGLIGTTLVLSILVKLLGYSSLLDALGLCK